MEEEGVTRRVSSDRETDSEREGERKRGRGRARAQERKRKNKKTKESDQRTHKNDLEEAGVTRRMPHVVQSQEVGLHQYESPV